MDSTQNIAVADLQGFPCLGRNLETSEKLRKSAYGNVRSRLRVDFCLQKFIIKVWAHTYLSMVHFVDIVGRIINALLLFAIEPKRSGILSVPIKFDMWGQCNYDLYSLIDSNRP